MKIKKISAAIIAAVMIAVMLLSACGNEPGGSISETGAPNDGGTVAPVGEQDEQDDGQSLLSQAPIQDFEGYLFRVLSRDESNARWSARDITAEAETGDPLNDATYRRNSVIEDKFNIKIVNIMFSNDNMLNTARRSIMSGDDDYDILMGGLHGFAENLAQEGMLADLKNVPYLDLAKPWYDQKANQQLTIANKLYVTVSDISTIARDATWAYLFNKNILADLALEDPYQLVREGRWTIDKMLELAKDVSRDLTGDGRMGRDDLYGYAGETTNLYYGLISAGVELIKKDESDLPVYSGGLDDAGLTAFNKLISMFGDKNVSLRADDWYGRGFDVWLDLMDASFMENRILFFDTNMANVQTYRSMETDFGIIPPPKLDESQTEYISNLTVMWTNSLCIPVTSDNFERTGIITDALAAESLHTVIPAYYDIQLKTKIARDDESADMLDLVFAGRKYDLAMIYNWGGASSVFSSAMLGNNSNIVSALEAIENRINSEIERTVGAFENFEH